LVILFSAILWAGLTWWIGVKRGWWAVVASALVWTVVSFFPLFLKNKKLSLVPVVMYCASFVGMSSSLILSNIRVALLWGALVGVIFILTQNVFNWIGGKLGTIAFVSTVLVVFVSQKFGLSYIENVIPIVQNSDFLTWVVIILTSVVWAVWPYLLSIFWKQGAVRWSALPSLIVWIVFLLFLSGVEGYGIEYIPIVFIGASFVGMASKKMVDSWIKIWFAGIVFGVIFMLSSSFWTGYGGGLGTTACISTVIVLGVLYGWKKISSLLFI